MKPNRHLRAVADDPSPDDEIIAEIERVGRKYGHSPQVIARAQEITRALLAEDRATS